MPEMRYKCFTCNIIVYSEDLDDGNCPKCKSGLALKEMCPLDHNDCGHTVLDGIAYCPECGAPVCPTCGCHDVAQISRVTGYLQEVSGWNAGKQQELKDRHRVTIGADS